MYPEIEPYAHGLLDVGDGHQVYWETAGNPHGKPALVVHGGPGAGCSPNHRRFFDPDRYRVVLFDQRGCGRSTPLASEPGIDLGTNTTWHLMADMELLRTHLGIESWLLLGGSWGATLALLYAVTHPERTSELVLTGVTTSKRWEMDWIFRGGVSPLFPEQWDRLVDFLPEADRGDVIAAYYRLLLDPDPQVSADAALHWCQWESATLTSEPAPLLDDFFLDPVFRLGYSRIVTHYIHHDVWLPEAHVMDRIGALADIPGSLVQGRIDLQAPLRTAWDLKNAWPRADLVLVDGVGHSYRGLSHHLVAATDRFAAS